MEGPNGEAINIKEEQVRLLYANGLTLIVANLIAISIFLYAGNTWDTPHDQLWTLILGILLIGQTILILLVRRISLIRLQAWRYIFLLGVLLMGFLWTSALMHLLAEHTDSTVLVLNVAIIGAIFLLTTLILTIDSFFSLIFVLSSISLLILNPLDYQLSVTEDFWIGLIAYLLALLILAAWMMANQQRFHLVMANRTLFREHLRQTEAELSELRNRLNAENDQRQLVEKELHLAKEAAETANLAKSEFLATMSHEIRTPLNGILPILEMLRETRLDKEQMEFVKTALNSSQLLLSIINDILDFSKIEAGKLDLEFIEVNISDMVEQVTSLMRNPANRRGLRLKYSIDRNVPKFVRGDPIRIRQIMTNLVSNAVKFTEKGEVSVEVSHRNSSGAEVELLFSVRDSGIGMSQEQVARLFEPFSQADASTTRKHGGTGLGLVICKRLTELMGGQIGVQSQQGQGSNFWFILPLRKSLNEIPSARRNLNEIRTLVLAEQTDDRINPFVSSLHDWGMLVEFGSNHYDAITKLKSSATLGASWRYELILVDGVRHAASLMQIINEAKRLPHMSDVMVVVLDPPVTDIQRLTEMEVALIESPVQPNSLEHLLKRLFDVEQISTRTGALAEVPMPRMPDDHLGWEDKQQGGYSSGVKSDVFQQGSTTHTALIGKVLVVEDNPVNQAVVKKMLEKAGLTPVTANDGIEAIEAIKREFFDIVLMDVQMPRMDGHEATKAIRKREDTKGLMQLPIIAMTANAMTGDRERCLDAGMNDYLPKPVKPAVLETMLRQWLPMQDVLDDSVLTNSPPDTEEIVQTTADTGQITTDTNMPSNVLDSTVLKELYEIMEDDFIAVLESYRSNAPSLINSIKTAVKQQDLESLVRPAHSLKSSSANVGAMELSILARELEFKGRQNDRSDLQELYNQTIDSYQRTMTELNLIIERGSIS